MNSVFIQFGLLGFLRLATSTFVASWVSSPMSWSTDGQWLSYTVVAEAAPDRFSPGWIFRAANDDSGSPGAPARLSAGTGDSSISYRIWATQPSHHASVLIEESPWPLSAAAWNPRGKSIAFCRFVPQSSEPTQPIQKGRYQAVIQDGLDRKHVVWSSSELTLDAGVRASLPQLSCSWSPDGIYLAIPRPGRLPAVEIVRTDTKKRVHVIEHASLPSWSPDGTRCAFIHHEGKLDGLAYVERVGPSFSDPRVIASSGAIFAAPHWSSDSRSIYAVMERTATGSLDLEIVRLVLDPSETIRLMPLAPDSARRRGTIRGLAIDFDREGERCFFSVDIQGKDCDLAWSVPRERVTHKRFHPLDVSQRIKALAVSPNGQWVAARFGSEDGLTPPAIYDSETEQTTLLVPDEDARNEWLIFLSGTARQMLKTSLPLAVVDGQTARRPTLLPLPGELPPMETTIGRLASLARFGSAVCSLHASAPGNGAPRPTSAFDAESRLFFHYLLGDYQVAAAALESLEPLISAPPERLGLLSVRAQLLWLRGQKSEARGVIDYLVSCEGPNRLLVEDTPRGPVFTSFTSPRQAWARYLSARLVDRGQSKNPTNGELPTNVIDPRPQDVPPIPEMPLLERGAVLIPFAPVVPGRQVR